MDALIPTALLPAAGLAGAHRHRGPAWRPFPLLPEGDEHDDGNDDGDDGAEGADGADDGDDADEDDDEGVDKLGDPGKKALDRMKAKRDEARTQLREFKALGLTPQQLAELVKGQTKPKGKSGDGDGADEVDADAIREEAKREAKLETLRERVLDKIEAKAGARFNLDPEDVAALVLRRAKNGADEFLDGDKVDTDAIAEALDDLLEKSPNLAAQGGPRFKGSGDQRPRKGGAKPQLTRDDLKKMTPAQVLKAQQDGQLRDLLAGKA